MDAEERVAEIRERAEAGTTLGPWIPEHGVFGTMLTAGRTHLGPLTVASVPSRRDAEFIANSREDIPWLLDRLRSAEAERDAALEAVDEAMARVVAAHKYGAAVEEARDEANTRAAEAEAVVVAAPAVLSGMLDDHYFGEDWMTYAEVLTEFAKRLSAYRAGADQ